MKRHCNEQLLISEESSGWYSSRFTFFFSLNGKETISFYDASPENILLLCVKPQGVNTVQGYNLFLKKLYPFGILTGIEFVSFLQRTATETKMWPIDVLIPPILTL